MTQAVFQQAVELLNNGKAQQANELLYQLVQQQPQNTHIHSALACSYLVMKQHDKAIEHFTKVTELAPKLVSGWADLAVVFYQSKQFAKAESALRQCIAIEPSYGNGQAWHYLANILFARKAFDELQSCVTNVYALDPYNDLIEQISERLEQGDLAQVDALSQQILQRQPQHPKALYFAAMSLSQKGLYEQAITSLTTGLEYANYELSLRVLLAQLFIQIRDYELALEHAEVLIEQDEQSLSNRLMHADILVNVGRYQEALYSYQQALQYAESPYYILLQQAHIHKILGNSDSCKELYEQCTADDEVKGSAFWGLATLSGYKFNQDDIQRLEALQLDPNLAIEQACQAGFALARAYEQEQNFNQAFTTYQLANANKQGGGFNVSAYTKKCDALIDTFHADLYSNNSAESIATPSVTPIFILGLPRVGSTLVEQILSSHSQVEATMELKVLPAIAREVYLTSCQRNQNNSGKLDKLEQQELLEFGQAYIDKTAIYRTNKPYFIDKLPPNFQHIGLIKKILPHALIIDVRRHPLSCGLGIFRQYFGQGFDFAYDLQHIGHYYLQYLRLMSHWHGLFPQQIHQCEYESLVNDFEAQVRSLLEYCQLPFEAECLAFYNNDRAVRTASSEQVRQPINRKGLALRESYQEQLAPLASLLAEHGVKL